MPIITKSGSGIWTPVISFVTPGTSAFSYTVQDGTWTRVQNRVFLDFEMSFTPTKGTGAGTLQIGGIPFDIADIANVVGAVLWATANLTYPAGKSGILLTANTINQLRITAQGSATGSTSITAADITDAATLIRGSVNYRTL